MLKRLTQYTAIGIVSALALGAHAQTTDLTPFIGEWDCTILTYNGAMSAAATYEVRPDGSGSVYAASTIYGENADFYVEFHADVSFSANDGYFHEYLESAKVTYFDIDREPASEEQIANMEAALLRDRNSKSWILYTDDQTFILKNEDDQVLQSCVTYKKEEM